MIFLPSFAIVLTMKHKLPLTDPCVYPYLTFCQLWSKTPESDYAYTIMDQKVSESVRIVLDLENKKNTTDCKRPTNFL